MNTVYILRGNARISGNCGDLKCNVPGQLHSKEFLQHNSHSGNNAVILLQPNLILGNQNQFCGLPTNFGTQGTFDVTFFRTVRISI